MSETTSPSAESRSHGPQSPTHQPEPDTSEHPPPRRSSIHRALKRTWRQLHYRFPRLVPSPYSDEREYYYRRDAEDNLATRVPTDEQLRQVGLWGVELFGPAEAEVLNAAIERLGWSEDQLFGLHTNPASWINEQRAYGNWGNLNLGVIKRPGKNRSILGGKTAPLPESVDYAHGHIHQLSPSVTAVIICFVLTESASRAYSDELNIDRKTAHEPLDNGYRSYNVEHVKRRAVDLVRTRSRALIVEWFATHFPGLFSRAPDGNRLPTAELITTTSQPLLAGVAERTSLSPDWFRLLSPIGHHEIWTLKDFDGLALCWPESGTDLRYHAIVNLRTNLLTADHLKHRWEENSVAAHASFVSDHIEGIMVNFAAIAALLEIIRFLRLTPASISADTKSRKGTVACLEQIRFYFDSSVGVPALTSELVARSEEARLLRWNCAAFLTKPWRAEEQPVAIIEVLYSRTKFLASRALSLEKETREHLEQLSAILSTRESIRTQARMELVAVGAAIVSIASLAVAVMSVDRFSTYINQQVERLYKTN